MKDLSPEEYDAILRSDLGYFAERCFCELNPQTEFLPSWHIEVIAAKFAAVREGKGSSGNKRAIWRIGIR